MKIPYYCLKQKQSLSLEQKIVLSTNRIEQWYAEHDGNVYVSLSGKDSTVLLHLVRSIYPNIPAVTVNTGLEHPENIKFIKNNIENVVWLKPEKSFDRVIREEGYPAISKMTARKLHTLQNPTDKNQLTRHLYYTGINSKGEYHSNSKLPEKWMHLVDNPQGFRFSHKCCDIMKKHPLKKYEREYKQKGFVGTLAMESNSRKTAYLTTGCNPYGGKGYSKPLSFWTEQDILTYIHLNDISISAAYGDVRKDNNGNYYTTGEKRTGCMFCLFGCHLEEEPNRIQRLQIEYPAMYDFCIRDRTDEQNGLGLGQVMELLNIPYQNNVQVE